MAGKNGQSTTEKNKCAVDGCKKNAVVEVLLYDVYLGEQIVFFERDCTCPFLCAKHMVANEKGADGVREPRGSVNYPFTNKGSAQGFTIYRPLRG